MGDDRALFARWLLACTAGELLGIAAAAGVALAVAAALGEPAGLGGRLLVLLALVLAGVLEGTLVGGFQWRVLRRRLPHVRARAWVGATVAVAANALGWAMGLPCIFLAASLPEAGTPRALTVLLGAAGGVLAGLCVAVPTGAVLVRLRPLPG